MIHDRLHEEPTLLLPPPSPIRFVSADVLQSLLDALPDQIVLVDAAGRVGAANAAWQQFAEANGVRGASYPDASRAACGDRYATQVVEGIRRVLCGDVGQFSLRYPRADASGPAWYEVRATRLGGAALAAVVHRPIADLVQTEERLAAALAQVATLTDRLEAESFHVRDEPRSRYEFEELVGETEEMRRVMHRIEQVARTDATVLLLGETGTGKELVARAIHSLSGRSSGPLVKVNCAALPSTLIESELFGHEKGAFTGAFGRKIGRFELANGGTIFLDEIGDVDPALQAKLLRVLQNGEFERVGSAVSLRADVRVIAATNRDLRKAIAAGTFREDLYYRLTVFPIEIPPLRDRKGDIPLLVWYFITKHQERLGRTVDRIPRRTMDLLVRHAWPGNVRELENVIERALIVSPDRTLRLDGVLDHAASAAEAEGGAPSQTLQDTERRHIVRVLEACGGRLKGRGNAAERLGVKPSTLRSRMKKLGISRSRPER